jgi:hypothetical protein
MLIALAAAAAVLTAVPLLLGSLLQVPPALIAGDFSSVHFLLDATSL